MKYMLLFMSPPTSNPAELAEGCDFEDWVRFDKAMKEAGIWVSGHPLQDLTTVTTVRVDADGERTVTDGPFVETREILGGYDVIDVPNLDVALEWAARSPGARDGSVQVRPIADFGG
ncbi:YciI family protein [Solwaraspora sp. WMMD1047]|uniref:YciI family protein n=1 Tax=Solwaraspora sp. WMMD1047 TaxID=3016102 RepID=UPI0024173904|nr:YciI family protein [Solwaraspora sp. WMMD1047]MDG4828310.1 YciI family protein [Solwaraspora sp. WMMD1047]